LLFALMAGGLFLSMSLPEAFGERGPVFATAFVGMLIGRTLFTLATGEGSAVLFSQIALGRGADVGVPGSGPSGI